MTRNEIVSDVAVGDILKIRTEYDLIIGRVDCLDETSIKVIRIDTGKAKRIIYDIIIDFDFETDMNDSDATVNVVEKNPMAEEETANQTKTVEDISISDEDKIQSTTSIRDKIVEIWGELDFYADLTVSNGYKEYSKRFSRKVKNKLNQYKDKVFHAQKMHEFTATNYRVVGVLAELSAINSGIQYANCLRAMIKYELGNIEEAEMLFYEGYDYESAFLCAYQQKKYTSCMNYAMNSYMSSTASEKIRKWLVDYASSNNREDIAWMVISGEKDIKTQMLLFWYKDDSCITELPNKEELSHYKNGDFLYKIFEKKYSEIDISMLTSQYAPILDSDEQTAETIENIEVQEDFIGTITRFETSKNFGFIDHKVFFYITQVIDEELQELLFTSASSGYRVSYTIGKNIKGDKAADKIRLIGERVVERKKGFISEYNRLDEFGRISCDGKEYNFILDSVSDPYLKADILDSNNLEMIDVTFVPSKKNNKKIATSIVSDVSYERETIESWVKSRLIKQSEVDAWEKKKAQANHNLFVPFMYESLMPLEQEQAVVEINNSTVGPIASRGHCNKAHYYLFSGDLQNAEFWYLEAIKIGEKLETAVPDLNSIYMRTGQLDKSIALLDKYSHVLKRDVYLNLKVQTLDKLKKHDDEFVSVCEELLENTDAVTRKMHFLLKLGQVCNDLTQYIMGIRYFDRWEKLKKQNFGSSASYELAHINMLQGKAFALYKLGKIEEAKEIANKILVLKNADTLALAIINEESVEGLIHEEIAWDDYWRDTQISKYILDCLDRTNLEVDKGIPHVVDGIYQGNEKDATKAIRYITGRKTANDQAKYDNFIAAAKLVKQILERGGTINEEEKINEQIYQFYIAKAMLFYGDYQLINAKTTNNFDMARYCYFQVTNIFKEVDKVYSCWLDSFLRYIQTFFADFDIIKKRPAPANDTCSDEKAKELVTILCDEFNGELLSDTMDFVIGLIVLFAHNANNKKYGEIVLDRLEKSHLRNGIGTALDTIIEGGKGTGLPLMEINNISLQKKWEYAIKAYSRMQDDFSSNFNQLLNKVFGINSYNMQKLQNHAFVKFLNKSEKQCWDEISKVLLSVIKYIETSDFDAKNDLLRQMLQSIDGVKDMIESSATMYTYEFILDLLNSIETQIHIEAKGLYEDSKPKISVSVPAGQQSSLNQESGEATVPINFTNKENVQNAENVRIVIEASKPFSLHDDKALRELKTIRSNGKGESILLHFMIDTNTANVKILEFSVSISYQYKVSIFEEEMVEEEPVRIAVPLYNQDEFEPIKPNPFEPYISGKVVSDKNMFFGRSKDIEEIIGVMSADVRTNNQGRALALYGQTRTGKSSLLYHVENGLRERDLEHNIIINTGSIGDQDLHDKDITELLYTILRTLEKDIKKKAGKDEVANLGLEQGQVYHPVLMENMKRDGISIDADKVLDNPERSRLVFNKTFKDFCEYVNGFEPAYNVVLMIDEFTYIYDWIRQGKMDSSITQWWKALLQNNNIFAIIIGQDHMMQFVNDISISPVISNDFQTTELKKVTYLSETDAKSLMSDPILLVSENGDKESRYKEGAIERLYELTSGSAFLIMNFCGKLVNYLNEQKSMYITRAHIDDFLKKNLSEFEESRFFEPQYNDKSEVDNTEIIAKNKEILKAIARGSYNREWANIRLLIEDPENARVIDKLVERDVLVRNGEERCKIKVALYKEWLIERYGLEG